MRKKHIFTIIFLFAITIVTAQNRPPHKERIKALKTAYITDQLNLTSKQAEKFWPIYNKFDEEKHQLRFKPRKAMKDLLRSKNGIDAVSNEEAKKLVLLKLKSDKKLIELEQAFIKEISNVIEAKQLLKLQIAEHDFGRKLMRKYKLHNRIKKGS